jgi:DtxR family transcriptional regulator, Mn-dependent transcriptional regulator
MEAAPTGKHGCEQAIRA